MTEFIWHKTHRISWNTTRHSYLVDTGSDLEIQQIVVSDLFEDYLLNAPCPETRFFEIEIDEVKKDGIRTGVFRNIWPVRAHRKPDWHILRFRIRRGSWHISERIRTMTPSGESQWMYADDFNILYLSSGGRYDAAMLLRLIIGKLDVIAQSIWSGSRLPSEFENKKSCRVAFDAMFSEGVDGAFRDTVVYKDHTRDFPGGTVSSPEMPPSMGISTSHGRPSVPAGQAAAGIHVDISQIEELRDLSWLYE